MTTFLNLTPREKEVLTLLANGKHNDEIAALLTISPHTAKFHVNSIFTKTQQTTRLGAVIYCIKLNMINIKDLLPELNFQLAAGVIKPMPDEITPNDMRDNMLADIMESVDKLSMDFGNKELKAEIEETLKVYIP